MAIKDIDGLPVIDAKRAATLTVKPMDVRRGETKNPNECAFARAAKRELHVKEIRVHLSRIYMRTNETNWVRYQTPPALRDEIIAFDRGGDFVPGDFTLMPVAKSERLGQRQSTSNKRGGGKSRCKPHIVTNVRLGPA